MEKYYTTTNYNLALQPAVHILAMRVSQISDISRAKYYRFTYRFWCCAAISITACHGRHVAVNCNRTKITTGCV